MVKKWNAQKWVSDIEERIAQAKIEVNQALIAEDDAIKRRENMERKLKALEVVLAECEGKTPPTDDNV